MKIGLLTIHHAYNHGAMLQSYASLLTLKSLGHEVEFINYDNLTFVSQRKLFLPNNSVFNILRNLRTLSNYHNIKERVGKFEEFYRRFPVSSETYTETSKFDLTKYDVVITGSDQTFSLYLTGNPEEMRAFFLDKAICRRKVSFASSMGEKFKMLAACDRKWMSSAFKKFDVMSVREDKSADFIKSLINTRPAVVLDPTLLVSREEWEKEIQQLDGIDGEYIAFYTVLSDSWIISYVQEFAKKVALKVIALHPKTRYDLKSGFEYLNNIGPAEFVSAIKNAKYVITTSFHAIVFSIIFNKQFIALRLGIGNRIESLLKKCKLEYLFIDNRHNHTFPVLEVEVQFDVANSLLKEEVGNSINFIKNALHE